MSQRFRLFDLHPLELSAPVPEPGETPVVGRWYRMPLSRGMSGDGSPYHIYLRRGRSDKLCVFLSGGGVAWNEYTAAHPSTAPRMAAQLPNYYWNNLRPMTQFMNIHVGITETGTGRNPFEDWNFIVVTYATGDFHVGRADFEYTAEDGTPDLLHFHGYANFTAAMEAGSHWFPTASKLLIAGNSAGAFAVPALAEEICDRWYKDCRDVTLFSDSGQLVYREWPRIIRDLWKADPRYAEGFLTDNLTLEWYRQLLARNPGRFRVLYASSTYDFLLSAYLNDVLHKEFASTEAMQQLFHQQLIEMVRDLRDLDPEMHFFIYDWKIPLYTHGGTVHTAVRELAFYARTGDGHTMAEWLKSAVEGEPYDVGLQLLKLAP